jgi:hypothetical protein
MRWRGRRAAFQPEVAVRRLERRGVCASVLRCSHLDQVKITELPATVPGCEECLATGDPWLHLRICLECGKVGCGDDSPNRHATGHAHQEDHPLIRSPGTGETPDDRRQVVGTERRRQRVVLASSTAAEELGVEPLARIVSSATHALDPQVMGIAPAFAFATALERPVSHRMRSTSARDACVAAGPTARRGPERRRATGRRRSGSGQARIGA